MGEERKTLTGMINDEHLSFTSFFILGCRTDGFGGSSSIDVG